VCRGCRRTGGGGPLAASGRRCFQRADGRHPQAHQADPDAPQMALWQRYRDGPPSPGSRRRVPRGCSRASRTMAVLIEAAASQLMIRREHGIDNKRDLDHPGPGRHVGTVQDRSLCAGTDLTRAASGGRAPRRKPKPPERASDTLCQRTQGTTCNPSNDGAHKIPGNRSPQAPCSTYTALDPAQ
jgi:hypothetical protein